MYQSFATGFGLTPILRQGKEAECDLVIKHPQDLQRRKSLMNTEMF